MTSVRDTIGELLNRGDVRPETKDELRTFLQQAAAGTLSAEDQHFVTSLHSRLLQVVECRPQDDEDCEVIDPNRLGPLGVCFICFHPRTDGLGYCQNCGNQHSFIMVDEDARRFPCVHHPGAIASAFCSACGEPICSACYEGHGTSMLTGEPTHFCFPCIAEMKRLNDAFLARTKAAGHCAKHPKREASLICRSCGIPHCDPCMYYKTAGMFRKRLGDGPYCLPCFRMATPTAGSGREHWISAIDARKKGWLSP